ncbi:hypothetical protein K438DRAFT_1846481 [Mycena galopus ATCC 62051]|nr:hypothetical protein K438DRAFT_1846481 [Mycena galopus ATCC 62051]
MGWAPASRGGSASASPAGSPEVGARVPEFAVASSRSTHGEQQHEPTSPTGAAHGHESGGSSAASPVSSISRARVPSSLTTAISIPRASSVPSFARAALRGDHVHASAETGSESPASGHADEHADEHDDPHAAPGSYVTHGTVSGIGAVLLRALRAGMPVWERGGDIRLLGGEFVFEWGPTAATPATAASAPAPTLRCTYAHRMQTPRGHASVARVLAAAGVHVPPQPIEDDDRAKTGTRDAQRLVRVVSGAKRGGGGGARAISRSMSGPFSLARASTSASTSALSNAGVPRSMSVATTLPHSVSIAATTRTLPAPDLERLGVPRSASMPPNATGMFSARAAGNIFTRFSGPRGGRAMEKEKQKRGRECRQSGVPDGGDGVKASESAKDEDGERPRIPRSASTPPMSISARASAIWESRERYGWAHVPHWGAGVGVIWEGDDADDKKDAEGREKEPAMRATLSASSSRPWALMAATGSCASLASEASVLSEDSAIIFKTCPVKSSSRTTTTTGTGSTSASGSSDPEPESDLYSRAGSEDGDDERSGSGSEDGRRDAYPFPRSVSEYGPGHLRPKSEAPGLHARAQSEYLAVRRDVYTANAEEDEDEYAYGYNGDGYGSPVDREDAWMRARAQSLARLRARKAVRRSGHGDQGEI